MQISEVRFDVFQPEILELLSFAALKADEEYEKYLNLIKRKVYACEIENTITACIGIEFSLVNSIEIKHIAVSPQKRGQQIGGKMIEFVCEKYRPSSVFAELIKRL